MGTYDVLIFLGVVSHFGDGDGPTDLFVALRAACSALADPTGLSEMVQATFVLQLQLNIEQCDDLALPLTDIDVAVHAYDLAQLGRGISPPYLKTYEILL